MISATTTVGGTSIPFASGGRGLPVLFLHGWGLDHRAYMRSLRRLTARSCRVIAPSLPGFGGTPGLPLHDQSLSAFSQWVDIFLDAVGVEEPVVVMGHSFGGGVATMFAHEYRDRVRHLVLLNSVGDPGAMWAGARRQGFLDAGRSILDPIVGSLLPSPRGARARHAQRLFFENARRDPIRVAAAALVAASADLRREMADLAAAQLPVSVLWSDHDGVIPLSAFDTFCSTFGAQGQVVPGGHSWLLTRPEAFGDVLDNVLHVQAEQHQAQTATATGAALRRQLTSTTLPAPVISKLTRSLSPLWLLSAAPSALATDLAMCHPRLGPGEVRAVARPVDSDGAHRLTVVAADRAGLLADTVAILANEGMPVESASAMTWPDLGLALHAVTVHAEIAPDPTRWDTIGQRLQDAAAGDIAVPRFVPADQTEASVIGKAGDSTFVRVISPDRVGLLAGICRWFADNRLSIEAADVSTVDGIARDTFLITGELDIDALSDHLSRPRSGPLARVARSVGIGVPAPVTSPLMHVAESG